MRKIVLWMGISLDGYFEGPNAELDWHRVDDEFHSHVNAELSTMGAFLHGRVMYENMAAAWPAIDADPASSGPMAEFARIWLEMPKFVYSRTLDHADWNTTVVHDVVPEEVMALTAQPGGDMTLGGADIAASFTRHGLIDEYRLYVVPVVLGRGRPLFPPSDEQVVLDLAETRTFSNGVVMLRYLVRHT